MDWIQQWQSKLNKQNGVAPLVRTGGSRHTGLAALPYRNIHFTYRHLKETSNTELISDVQTKLLHDNAFDQLMNYLNKNEHLSNHNIGDFIEINDEFYIMDLDYYKKIFNDKKFLDFMKKNDRDKIQALLKIQQDIELEQEGANSNEIKKIYTNPNYSNSFRV